MLADTVTSIREAVRTRPRLSEVYYGWWIVAAAILAFAVSGGLTFWTFTVYITPLESEFGWSRSQLSLATSIGFLVGGVSSPLAGFWIDRYGSRSAIVVGAILTGVCTVLLIFLDALWQLYALYGAAAFFRSWMSFIPFQALLTRWFSHRLGLAVAISSCGFNIGGIIFVPLVTLLVDSLGWRHAYFISGVLIMITLVPLALLIVRNRPSDKQMSVEEAAFSTIGPAGKAARPRRNLAANWRLRDILRTRSFWLLAVTFSIFFIGPISFMLHAVPFFESRDLSRSTAAAIISYQALVALGARVFFGLMADRISEARLLGVGTALLSAAALAVLLAPLSPFVLVIFVLLWGIAAGAGPLLETLILSRAFGVGAFGSLLGMLMAVETVGMIAGPYFGGYIFDASGSYTLAFLIYIAGFIVAACGFALFRSPAPRLAPAPSEASAVA